MPLIQPNLKHGFTLIEMAMVLMIVGLLLGSLLGPITAQLEQRKITETLHVEESIIEALIGYAIINGRLPCPASSTSNGVESFASGGNEINGLCSHFYTGLVPAVTLGLNNIDIQGYAMDRWNNRLHYAVTSASSNIFTKTNGISLNNTADYLYVCSSASANGSTCSVANSILTASAPALVYSTGKNGGSGGMGADEAENPNSNSTDNDKIFVSHSPSASGSSAGEFDDLVVWMSPNILFGRLVAAGKLP